MPTDELTLSGNEITDAVRAAGVSGDGLPAGSGIGIWESTTNLCPNGGAETDTRFVFGRGGVITVERDTAYSKFGAASVKLTCPAESGDGYTFWHNDPTSATEGGTGKGIPVAGGQTYTFSAWIKIPVALTGSSPHVGLRLIEWTGAAGVVKDTQGPNIVPIYGATFDWVRVSFTVTLQATTTNVSLRININTSVGSIWVDGVQFEQRSCATPYVETDGATVTRPSAQPTAPASLLDVVRGGVVFRARMGMAYNSGGAGPTSRYVLQLSNGTQAERIVVNYTNQTWRLYNIIGGSTANVGTFQGPNYAEGDKITGVAAWDDDFLYLSINGADFATFARVGAPAAGSLLELGHNMAGQFLDGSVEYVALFTGDPTSLDPAAIHERFEAGEQPSFGFYPAAAGATAIMPMRDATIYLPAATAVALASHRLQIAWGAYNHGLISFDTSTFDGTDVFGVSPLDVRFGSTDYDDVSSRLQTAHVERGADDTLTQLYAGEASFVLRDPAGDFDPENVDGPLYGLLEDRLHPVRWDGTTAGGTRGMFTGWAHRLQWQPSGRKGVTQVDCVDAFVWLSRVKPTIASTGVTTTGAAIGLILDAAGLTDPAMRDLDNGDTIPDFSADGSQPDSETGLDLIGDLLAAERGIFYVSGAGILTYRSRVSRLTLTSSATFDGRVRAIAPGVDFDQPKTRATVSRTDPVGNVLYTAVATADSDTIHRLGEIDLDSIETPYLASDAACDALAAWLILNLATALPPTYDFTIDGRDADLLEEILDRDLVDRITADLPKGNTQADFHIDHLAIDLAANGMITAAWLLSRVAPFTPIQMDVAVFDGDSVFV